MFFVNLTAGTALAIPTLRRRPNARPQLILLGDMVIQLVMMWVTVAADASWWRKIGSYEGERTASDEEWRRQGPKLVGVAQWNQTRS